MARGTLLVAFALSGASCGHAASTSVASSASPTSTSTAHDASSSTASAVAVTTAEGTSAPQVGANGALSRAAILPVLDAGLGRFLQGVSTQPVLEGGRFVGFRLLALYPNDARFRAVDLHPGDVVTRVNGTSIERPERAAEVWNGLRVASELVVEYRRGSEARMLRYAIVE